MTFIYARNTVHCRRCYIITDAIKPSKKDGGNLKDTTANLNIWLKAIDNNQLLWRFKVWCFQYGTIPRLQWQFLLYDFAMTQVEAMDRLCSKFVWKWLGVAKALSSIKMYIRASKFCLPISSVVEEWIQRHQDNSSQHTATLRRWESQTCQQNHQLRQWKWSGSPRKKWKKLKHTVSIRIL